MLNDGVVANPVDYNIDSFYLNDQVEDIVINDEEGGISLSFNKNVALATEEGNESYVLDLKKLSDEQIAKIVDTVIKRKPKYVDYMYHIPAQGLQTFMYKKIDN